MNIAVVGLGLIGGSMARAVKAYTNHTVYGFDRSQDVLDAAIDSGAIDCVADNALLNNCDLTIVCLYPSDSVKFISEHAPVFKKESIVMDFCGVKRAVCDPLKQVSKNSGFYFVGAHPMAGTERTGFRHSFPEMFKGASLIVTPFDNTPEIVMQTIGKLAYDVGFSRLQYSTPEEHDHIIAYTSQLAHVVSCAYVGSPTAPNFEGFSAGSLQDMTRVARLNENMWSEIFIENGDFLAHEIDGIVSSLNKFAKVIRNGDRETLREMLKQAREIKQSIDPQDWE